MSQEFLPEKTETFLHQQIPLSRSMGVKVIHCDDHGLRLTAPLEANHNHLGTAFGGSLGALATLAGYALLWIKMGDPTCHLVIRSSQINFLHPVGEDIQVVAHQPTDEAYANFIERFQLKGRARIKLRVTISEHGTTCVEFSGEFVAISSV